MKIRPVGAELFNADGQTGRHDKANSRFSQFCERAYTRYFNRDSVGFEGCQRLQFSQLPVLFVEKV